MVILFALAAAPSARAQAGESGAASAPTPAATARQEPAVAARPGPDASASVSSIDKPPDDRPDWAEPGTSASLVGALVRMLLVLVLVVALIYLTLNFGLRRLMHLPQGRSVVTVHERTPLEPKKSVYLVEVAGEFLLLGVGESEINLLAKLEKEQAEQALARKKQVVRPDARPFWERLSFKPSPRKPAGGGPS